MTGLEMDDMLREALARRAPARAKMHVVYFLFCADKLVYIGQSAWMSQRLAQHTGKIFDSLYSITVADRATALRIEAELIDWFRPYYNSSRGKGAPPKLTHGLNKHVKRKTKSRREKLIERYSRDPFATQEFLPEIETA